MISLKDYIAKIKDVKMRDILAIGQFVLAYPVSKVFKHYHKNFWLVCEDEYEARDNGYWMYKYIRTHHKEQECFYAINPKSVDYKKVSKYGNIIPYGTFKHWVYYLAAEKNISSQKGGKPNAAACYLLEVNEWLKNTRIFLQHGVIKDDCKWLHYEVTKFSMFICGAKPEYDYVDEIYGYPNGILKYTGLCRYDGLHNINVNKKQILIMPTWRNWFNLNSKNSDGKKENFETSEYLKKWNEVLKSPKLKEILKENELQLIFYPHRNVQKYIHCFKSDDDNIIIADWKKYDIQKLLKESALLITDYSSVFFDFVYMKKPLIFYQFDEERFRKTQYQQGYFDYHNNGFGKTFSDVDGVLKELEIKIKDGFEVKEEFLKEHSRYFPKYDNKNCERIYNAILRMEEH